MTARWRRVLEPPDLGDPDTNRVVRTQHWVLLLASCATVAGSIGGLLTEGTPPTSLGAWIFSSFYLITCLLLLWSGRPRLSGAIFACGCWTVGTLATLLHGLGSAAPTSNLLAILLAGFFWSPRRAYGMALVSVVVLGVVAVVQAQGQLPDPPSVSPARLWVSLSVIMVVTAAILRLGFIGMAKALEEARRAATEAKASERALAESQRQLEEARRLEALGRLAGGVAHDFNNLLTVITANARVARGMAPGPGREELLEEIDAASHRAGNLTAQLLAFGRGQVLEPRALDLSTVVAGVEPLLRRVLGEGVNLTLRLAPDLPAVWADASQLEQVVLNLAANARDALPRGGRVVIETAPYEDVPGRLPAGEADRRHVALVVTDDGEGMDEATRQSVFEPFFTTKAMGRGTGLGLATVHGVVSQSDGHVWVESEAGEGSRFVVVLPVTEAPAGDDTSRQDADVPEDEAPGRMSGVVLLVEDDDGVRLVVQRMLQETGLEVVACADPAEALSVNGLERVDVLVSDVVMPGMMGPALVGKIRELRPGLPAILISGYPRQSLGEVPTGPDIWYLPKPFDHEDLVRVLREALSGASRPPAP